MEEESNSVDLSCNSKPRVMYDFTKEEEIKCILYFLRYVDMLNATKIIIDPTLPRFLETLPDS